MKILVGVDTSSHSRATVSALCRMSWPKGTSVVVLSAVAPTEPGYAPEPHVVASVAGALAIHEAEQVETHEELVSQTERTLRDAGFVTEGRVVKGDPRRALTDAARADSADLVVVGSHGHSGLGRAFLGSVASYVIAHAPCDVLVIRRNSVEAGS
jgi:nucleotide-binding universal stress UspA family protein